MSRSSTLLILALLSTAVVAGREHHTIDTVRLLFTGDILLSREVEVELQHRKVSPWTNLASLFRDVDWVGGNFEGALGARSQCIVNKSPCFATAESAVQLLKQAGFHGVTVENNHASDLGRAGREHTRTLFQQAGLMALDFDNSPQFLRLGRQRSRSLPSRLFRQQMAVYSKYRRPKLPRSSGWQDNRRMLLLSPFTGARSSCACQTLPSRRKRVGWSTGVLI